MNTILIESNCKIANAEKQKHLDTNIQIESNNHDNVVKNSSWSTNIESSILLQPGDQISLESATVNIKGAGTENQYQTFTGNNIENNDTDVVDNEMVVELCYYVNNNCQFNVNLPLGTATRTHSSLAGIQGGATFLNEEYGAPCFDGTNLFGSSWTSLQEGIDNGTNSASIIRDPVGRQDIAQVMTSMNFYNHKKNGWCCNKGVFFNTRVAQDISKGMQTLTSIAHLSVPNHTAGSDNDAKLLQCEMMGFKSFLDNTPQWGLAGTQFSQADPFPDSVNQNIDNKDKGIFVRDQQPVPGIKSDSKDLSAPDSQAISFTQGGANPLQILPAGFWNEKCLIQSRGQTIDNTKFIQPQINAVAMAQHGVYGESLAKIAFNTYPEDFADFADPHDNSTNPVYQEPIVIESTRFKGGRNTTCSNNIKMYCSNYDDVTTANAGPYYNPYTNDCIPVNHTPVDVLDFRNNDGSERDTKYFHFLKTKINVDVGIGNITPAQVAEKITQVFKETSGSASRPLEDIQITPAIYDVYNNNETKQVKTPYGDVKSVYQSDFIDPSGSIGVIKREKPVISTKAFKSYPTFSGFIWETIFQQQQLSKTGASGLNIYDKSYLNSKFWTCTEPDSVQLFSNIGRTLNFSNTQVGQNYSEFQARDKFYKIMLVGNPKEWRSICKMNPMVQSTPCTMNKITHYNFYKAYSIYTGYTPEVRGGPGFTPRKWAVPLRRSNNNKLMAQDESTNPYMVGQYGCNSCILEGGKDLFKLDNAVKTTQTSIFQNDWYMGAKSLSKINTPIDPQPAGFVQKYNIDMGRTQRTAIYTDSNKVASYYKPNRLDMMVSNIIFDGNIRINLWNGEYQELVKLNNKIYNSTTNSFVEITEKDDFQNSISSQSSTFYDNNYVEWTMGRIDDQYSYPENPSNNFQTNLAYDYTQCRIGMQQQPVAGRTGTARFLPNIYKTYELYLQKPYLNAELTESGANGPPVSNIKNCLAPYTDTDGINGSYAMVNECTCYTPNNMNDPSYNEENNGQSVFRTNNVGYDLYNVDESVATPQPPERPLTNDADAKRRGGQRNFGLPSWSTFGRDFDPTPFTTNSSGYNPYKFDSESNNNPSRAYQKAMRRCVKGFRYLPQVDNCGNKITYWNKQSALNETIPLPPSIASKFSTKPQTVDWFSPQGRLDFDDLWTRVTTLNNGKGIGVIPLFYKNDPVVLASLNKGGTEVTHADRVCNLPFLTIILQQQEDDDMFPVPETGEYLSLGTQPSLSQNELAFPATTQQVNLQENPSSILTDPILNNGDTNLQNTYYQQNVGQQDGFGATENLIIDGQTFVKNFMGLNPSQRENITQFLASGGKALSNTIQVGANDININYSQDSNRYSFNNLHTLSATGNGVFQLGNFGPSPSPETAIVNSMNKQSAFSQQINLPVGYIEKNNDPRGISGEADASFNWACSANFQESDVPEPFGNPPPDLYTPGPCGGFGVDQTFIKVRQAQSIEGNVIQQTYSNLDPSANDIHMRTIGDSLTIFRPFYYDLTKTLFFTQSVEPGCITRQGYLPDASGNGGFGGQGYRFNFPLTGVGHKTKIILNPTHMSPFSISQYKLRCLTQKWIINGESLSNLFNDDLTSLITEDIDVKNIMFLLPPTLRPYAYVRNNPLPYSSTGCQSGVSINNIFSKTTKNTEIELTSLDYRKYEGSLFDKLGFQLNQFKPIYSLTQTILETQKFNKFVGTQVNAYKTFSNQLAPVSTNQITTSSNALGLVNGFGTTSFDQPRNNPNFDMPMFNLGQINVSASATQNTANLLAINPPSYINFPYLVCHSNIIAGCELQYMGGSSGRQLLPAIAPLQTNYALNDFIYVGRSDLIFTITKPTSLTELQTSIHYPTGELAENILDKNSSIIYRIDFAQRGLDDFVSYETDDDDKK